MPTAEVTTSAKEKVYSNRHVMKKRTDKIKKGTVVFDRQLDISYLITEILADGYKVIFGNRNRTKTSDKSVFCEKDFFDAIDRNTRRFGMID